MRTIAVGNCSGFYGDRLSAMREMIEGGRLDYVTGDYLAELTMLILGRDRLKDPSLGYAKTFVRQLTESLALAAERGVKIVANAGGLNPAGLAERVRAIAAEQGLTVSVAHVEGDALTGYDGALTANAYLGAFGIAAALEAGADVVVTGRVTDASVVMGPAIAEFGWGRGDFDALAGALVAGHVIECGAQATGGNFSGFTGIDLSRPLGFPIAEIDANGTSVITKHAGTGGAVTVDTVAAQLLYEIGGPVYLNPDVAARLDTAVLTQQGPDRVAITGVTGTPPPPTTKVCLNALGGYRNSVEFVLTGLDIEAKAAWVRAQVDEALVGSPAEVEWRLDRTDKSDPATEVEAAAFLRCHVRSDRPEPVGRVFSDAAVQIGLASYPGFHLTSPPGAGSPYGVYRAEYVPQTDVPHVVVHADGTRQTIAPPPLTTLPASGANLSRHAGVSDESAPLTGRIAPLGELVFARSGDKGGNANLGVWVPADHPNRAAAFAWLVDTLTEATVRRLLPEAAELELEIHPFDNLAGVNIVIHGLLGEGVASSTRFDPQAKALGEWLRARHVTIPEEYL